MVKIMLVDDEPNVLRSLRRAIQAMRPETLDPERVIEMFSDPELALVRARECEFDLVISDWRMPTKSGVAFLNELIQIQPHIARLVLSAYSDFLAELKAVARLKVFHFINKPWDTDELGMLMRQSLEHRRLLMVNQRPSHTEMREQARLSQMELRRIDREQPRLSSSGSDVGELMPVVA